MLYFGAPDDVVASDPSRASRGPPFVSPPRGWPGCFSSNKALKSFLGGKQQLGGKRVRLTEEPSASDLAAVAEVDLMLVDELQPDDPFGNAERVRDALGWEVRKGFAVLELEAAPGEAWVAHRRWWNAAPEASGEKWVDFTPRPAGLETLVLVESARGDKQPAPPSAALRAAAEQRLALGGLVAAAPVEAAPEPPEPPEPTTPPRKPRPQPPSTPPKLAFSGHETLGELVTLLSRGSAQDP